MQVNNSQHPTSSSSSYQVLPEDLFTFDLAIPNSPSQSSSSSSRRATFSSDAASSPDSALGSDHNSDGNNVRRLSDPISPPTATMLKLDIADVSYQQQQHPTSSYVELRSDFPIEQLSTSAESGYFDSFDLQTILDSSQQQQQQQDVKHVILPSIVSSSSTLTPDATPEDHQDDRLEWTYLEPAVSSSPFPSAATSTSAPLTNLVPLNISAAASLPPSSSSTLLTPPITSVISPQHQHQQVQILPQHHQQQQIWSHNHAVPSVVKTEPLELAYPDSAYSVGVALPTQPVPPPNQAPQSGNSKQRKNSRPKVSKPPKTRDPNAPPRLCHVCGEGAGKHSYYGGQVCPSCRAFFRRSVQSK